MCVPSHFRQVFPCGLEQPQGSFRASADALLLTSFASRGQGKGGWRFADLGTGCGIVACALLLAKDDDSLQGLGIEREAALAAAAQINAERLGLTEQLTIIQGDVGHAAVLKAAGRGTFDLVLANPPYGIEGRGRPSPHALRQGALVGTAETLDVFFAAGAALLRHHGTFTCVLTAARLGDALHGLRRHALGLRRMQTVHSTATGPALRILLEARKNAAEDVRIEAPVIHAGLASAHGKGQSGEALVCKDKCG